MSEQDGIEYLEDLSSRLVKFKNIGQLGEELQKGTRLSKTNKGARTNARIEASQKEEGFNETLTPEEELKNVDNDITNELLNRAIENLFGE